MGIKASKAEPEENLIKIPLKYLMIQGMNDHHQCGKNGHPFSDEKVVIAASGGMSHTIAIISTGEFVSWGSNEFGQLGSEEHSQMSGFLYEPSNIFQISIPPSLGRISIISISAGVCHSACVTDSNVVLTWGLGTEGQLGLNPKSLEFQRIEENKFIKKPTPVDSLTSKGIVAVYCGSNYTIVLSNEKRVYSFGNGQEGVLGNGFCAVTHMPQEVMELNGVEIRKLTLGWNHCLALTKNGKVYAWGNQYKDIIENIAPVLYPQIVEELDMFKVNDIACGDYHSCAVADIESGVLFVWGSNGYNQLGNPSYPANYISYVPEKTSINCVSHVACGGLFTLAKLKDGSVLGWGCNRQKQISKHLRTSVAEPTMIIPKNNFIKRIATGYSTSLYFTSVPMNEDSFINQEAEVKRSSIVEKEVTWNSKDYTND